MKKGQSELILISVLAILLVAGGFVKSPFAISNFGFTTLGISQTSIALSDSILSGKVWVLTITPGGLGQSVAGGSGTIPSDQLKTIDGAKAASDILLNIISQSNLCEYPIIQDTSAFRISNYGYKKYSILTSNNDVISDCSKFGQVVQAASLSFDKYCIYKNVRGYVGKLPERPNELVSVDVELKKSDDPTPIKGTLSNKAQQTVKLGDKAYAVWLGGLSTYDQCPQALQSNKMAAYDAFSASWRITDSTKYDNYKNTVQTGETKSYESETQIQNDINNFNYLSDQAMSSVGFYSPKGTSASTPTGGLTTGVVKIDIDDAIQIPILTFYIKTDWLAILQPVAKPQIQDTISVSSFTTGQSATVSFTVKNIGDSGTIQTYISCPSPFSVTSGTSTKSINSGSSDVFQHTISAGGVTTKTSATCTATAQALSNIDTKTFIASVDPLQVCSPNQRSCDANKVTVCNAAGSLISVLEDCSSTSKTCGILDSGAIGCKVKDTPPPTCKLEGQSKVPIIDKCCTVASDGSTPLVEKNGICVKQEGFPIFETGLIVLALAILAFAVMK